MRIENQKTTKAKQNKKNKKRNDTLATCLMIILATFFLSKRIFLKNLVWLMQKFPEISGNVNKCFLITKLR